MTGTGPGTRKGRRDERIFSSRQPVFKRQARRQAWSHLMAKSSLRFVGYSSSTMVSTLCTKAAEVQVGWPSSRSGYLFAYGR